MRMKAAFAIIVNQDGSEGKPQVEIPPELEAAARLLPSRPTSSRKASSSSARSQPREASSFQSPQEGRAFPQPFSFAEFASGSSSSSANPDHPHPIPHPSLATIPEFHLEQPSPPALSNTSSHNYAFPSGALPPSPTFLLNLPLGGPQTHLHPSVYNPQPHFNYNPPGSQPPPFPAQFQGLEPSSRSSPSLARLFAMKPADEPGGSRTGAKDLDLYRQDPVHLGYLSEEQSRELFDLFIDKINPRICSYDPELHTHDFVRNTSQLLFSTILSVSLKFSPYGDPTTRARCLSLARDQILRIVSDDGFRTVESVQALLLSIEYRDPDDEQAYLFLGMACRLAMDLDLGTPLPHLNERMNRNRYRAYLNCFNSDRRFAGCGQTTKPTMMTEDAAIRNSSTFHRNPLATPHDARLVAATHLRRMLARYDTLLRVDSERPGGPDSPPLINLRDLFEAVSSELTDWGAYWKQEIETFNPGGYVLQLILNQEHGKLQIAHHWLYQAFRFPNLSWIHSAEDWGVERRAALASCIAGSIRILKLMCTVPNDSITYSPDTTHLFFSYSTFFLAKMFRARVLEAELFNPSSIAFIFDVVRQAAEKLESATLDPTHTTALHATLLRSILATTPRPTPSPFSSPFGAQHQTHAVFTEPPPFNPEDDPPSPFLSSLRPRRALTHLELNGTDGLALHRGGEGDEEDLDPSSMMLEGEGLGEGWWLQRGSTDASDGSDRLGELDYSIFDFRPPN